MALMIVLASVSFLAFRVQRVEASGTIYIRANGLIEGTDKIITADNITYTFIGDINGSIVVERDSIVIDGASYTLQGIGSGNGIYLSGRENVMVRNTQITAFDYGIYLDSSSNNGIDGNNITANKGYGIELDSSSNNSIDGNNIANNQFAGPTGPCGGIGLYDSSDYDNIFGNNVTANYGEGIWLSSSSNNQVAENDVTNNGEGIGLSGSPNNCIAGNNVTNCSQGIRLSGSSNNILVGNNLEGNRDGMLLYSAPNSISGNNITNNVNGIEVFSSSGDNSISGNNITNNEYGIYLYSSSSDSISGNNFINNTNQAVVYGISINTWDDGYPSGGNYWSDYTGVDLKSGPYQNITGSDGIGDTPYIIDANNTDHYPLMTQHVVPEFSLFLILPLFMTVTLLVVVILKKKAQVIPQKRL
jgi:parallel beta-helix repeat protein